MNLAVDVVIVGGGPAALAAADELRRHNVDALVIADATTDLSPRLLMPRAQQELVGGGLPLPPAHTLTGASVFAGTASQPMQFRSPILAIDGQTWAGYLRSRAQMLGHDLLAGRARLVDGEQGLLDIEIAGGERRRISARTIIWAAGAPPTVLGRRATGVATVHRARAHAGTASPLLHLRVANGLNGKGDQLSWTMPSAGSQVTYTTQWWTEPPLNIADHGEQELVEVHCDYRRRRSGWGRVLLVGAAAGLANSFTSEGISHALISGRLAGRAAAADGARERYLISLGSHFGHGSADRVATERRHALTVKALQGAVQEPTAARKRIVGLVVDLQDGESHTSSGLDRTAAPLPQQVVDARARVQVATAREAADLWFAAAPSLARVPSVPDLRLSDVVIACIGDADVAAPRTALAGAAVDLVAGSIGFLASAVGNDEVSGERNWVEIASVAAHDVLACRAVRIAAQAGADVLDVCLAWMESIVRLRQRQRSTGAKFGDDLYEVGFLLSTRVAAVLREELGAGALQLEEVGRTLGRGYLLGEERRLVDGARSRLGLDREETLRHGLGRANGGGTLEQRLVAHQELWDETVRHAGSLFSEAAQAMLHAIHRSAVSGPRESQEEYHAPHHDDDSYAAV